MKSKYDYFSTRLSHLRDEQTKLLLRNNILDKSWTNGIFERYQYPILTAEHIPLFWRFDLDRETNPYLLERMGVNGVFNAGAIEIDGKVYLVVRVEGYDRKSFFAVAESESGVDQFSFWDYPVLMPETNIPDINVYDMRLTKHEDGWVYGIFCTERKDPNAPRGDMSSAIAQAGIARTKDLVYWERLPDLITKSAQQRNVVLHPEFYNGKYAFYTRPQDSFIEAGSGGGIGWGLCDDICSAKIENEKIINTRQYHTIKESKNGAGAPPLKTREGWLHIAHGVRNTAAGLRYVLYTFLCDLNHPDTVTHEPGGYFIAPVGGERVGDVSNVVFSNGAILRNDGRIFVYYASSDSRMHVAVTDENRILDYLINTPEDGLRSLRSVEQRNKLIKRNLEKGLR